MGGKKRTHEQFIKEMFDLVNNEYTLLCEYKNTITKVKIRHTNCGNEWEVTPKQFLGSNNRKGTRCPKCFGNIKKTHQKFVEEIDILYNKEYEILEEYINDYTKIKVRHLTCNNEYHAIPSTLLQKKGCKKCAGTERKTTEQFQSEVYNLVENEYVVLGEYKNCETKISMLHTKCNTEYMVKPNNFLNGQRCPVCNGGVVKTHEKFIKEVYELVSDEYSILGKYVNSHTKVLVRHNTCNNEYFVTPGSFLNGTRCPQCNNYKSEIAVEKYLNNFNIENTPQYKFQDCRNILPLPFDFAIYKKSKVFCLVEVDGKQHFEPIEHFGGEKEYEKRKKHDQIKNDYCLKNNIPLIRIPYWDFKNIEQILNEELNALRFFN